MQTRSWHVNAHTLHCCCGGLRHLSRSAAVLQFCADVPPGNARAKECLEDNREAPGFTPQCREEVEKMMADRAADFRLDPKLRQLCADDILVAPRCMPAAKRHPEKHVACCF